VIVGRGNPEVEHSSTSDCPTTPNLMGLGIRTAGITAN